MRSTFCLLISIVLLTACSSVRYINIDTYNPSEITFPDNISEILIVNNAASQPADIGHAVKVLGVEQDTIYSAASDSALYYTCQVLGKTIAEENYFHDVLLYDTPLRTDGEFLSEKRLTSQQVADLCSATATDAIISLDRLLLKMEKEIVGLVDDLYEGKVTVYISAVVRTYLPGRENALAAVLATDSVYWSEVVTDMKLLPLFLPSPEEAMKTAGKYIGQKIFTNFVPYWKTELRWIYTDMGSDWKEASAYAQAEKWDLAIERWQAIYNKSSNWFAKAKSASNLALSYEVSGDLEKANEWIQISSALFDANAKEEDEKRKNTAHYKDALQSRFYLNVKLDKQIGED